MGNPTNFIATVGIEIPEDQLRAASEKIKATLKTALEGIDLKAFKDLADSAKVLAENSSKAATEGIRLQKAFEGLAQAEEKTAQAKERTRLVTEQVNQQIEKGVKLTQQQTTVTDSLAASFQKILGGASLGSALSQPFQQLTQALAGIGAGGDAAKAGLAALGVEGTTAISSVTASAAALGAGLLTLAPIALDMGAKLAQAFGAAYEQQKEFIFQADLVSQKLGITAREGAQLRSLLTVIGQENNVFASITLTQIQASLAALDRVDKGLEKPNAKLLLFGDTLKQLGIDFRDGEGNVKNFLGVIVEMSAALEKLPASARSLAVQNLAGLFGGDVASLFGEGPERLQSIMDNAVNLTEDMSAANKDLQVSATNLASAQTTFNIALTNSLVPLETYLNLLRQKAYLEGEKFITGAGPAANAFGVNVVDEIRNLLGASKSTLIGGLLSGPIDSLLEGSMLYRQAQSDAARRTAFNQLFGSLKTGTFSDSAPTTAALKDHYLELDSALQQVAKDQKAVADIQADVVKNNEEVAKSFSAQVDALQKTAQGYDSFYTKVAETQGKIAALEAKYGKPFTMFGEGGKVTQDLPLAVANVKVMEERLANMDAGKRPAAYEKLQLQIERARKALGLQAGEATTIANVDVRVGITTPSKKDLLALQELSDQLAELKKEFLQGGFDVTQTTFGMLAGTLTDNPDFLKFLSSGAGTLQDFANSLDLFASPGFAQAIGESALQAKLLAGGFGEINTAAGAAAAFQNYVDAFGDLRSNLFDLSKYIADPKLLNLDSIFKDLGNYQKNPKKFQIPVAISLGLVSEADVQLANQVTPTVNVGSIADAAEEQAQAGAIQAAKEKLAGLGSGQGIVAAVLAKYGVTPGQAIKSTLNMTLGLKVDKSLVQKGIDANDKLAKDLGQARDINAKWNLHIDFSSNVDDIRAQLQAYMDALGAGAAPAAPRPPDGSHPRPGSGRAAGGLVGSGFPYLVGEEGKPELFMPSVPGRILPGNQTADILRGLGSRERLPSQALIHYAPVVQQTLNVDARGTNAREVTQAIQRAKANSMFVSSSEFVRSRDAVRARGLRY